MGIGTRAWIGALGIIIGIINISKQKKIFINHNIMQVSVMILLMAIISMISQIFNNTTDFQFVSYVPSAILMFSGAYVIGIMCQNKKEKNIII